jgi:hypothetical protein
MPDIPEKKSEGSRTDSVAGWDTADLRRLIGRAVSFDFPLREHVSEYRVYSVQWRGSNSLNPELDQWVICDGFRMVWSKDGEWVHEGMVSNRDDRVYAKTRWPLAAAVAQCRSLAQAEGERLDALIAARMRRLDAAEGGDPDGTVTDTTKVL